MLIDSSVVEISFKFLAMHLQVAQLYTDNNHPQPIAIFDIPRGAVFVTELVVVCRDLERVSGQ